MEFKFFKVCFPSLSILMIDKKKERTIDILDIFRTKTAFYME